jgi:DNA recombination protein RmuC
MKIFETGRDLYERICIFSDHFESVGRGLGTAVKSFNAAVGSWESRVLPGIRRMKDLGASSEKRELPDVENIDMNIREIRKAEDNGQEKK